jgi:CcmD family protein
MVNLYLVVAYGLVWGVFTLYAWIIQRRQDRLEKELQELKDSIGQKQGLS